MAIDTRHPDTRPFLCQFCFVLFQIQPKEEEEASLFYYSTTFHRNRLNMRASFALTLANVASAALPPGYEDQVRVQYA